MRKLCGKGWFEKERGDRLSRSTLRFRVTAAVCWSCFTQLRDDTSRTRLFAMCSAPTLHSEGRA
ncbi:MAG: hypothetical protein ACLUN5_14010 [Oscillospiraceae bacterium]